MSTIRGRYERMAKPVNPIEGRHDMHNKLDHNQVGRLVLLDQPQSS